MTPAAAAGVMRVSMLTREVFLLFEECQIRSWVRESRHRIRYLLLWSLHFSLVKQAPDICPHHFCFSVLHLMLKPPLILILNSMSWLTHCCVRWCVPIWSAGEFLFQNWHILEPSTHISMSRGRCEMWAKKYSCRHTVGTLILSPLLTRCNYDRRSYKVFDCHDVWRHSEKLSNMTLAAKCWTSPNLALLHTK